MATDFSTKYTDANIAQDAAQYDPGLFQRLYEKLSKALHSDTLAIALIASILCAQARGDTAVRVFRDVTKDKSETEVRAIFTAVREAVTLAVPFVGLPNCMPACFGLVNELKGRGIEEVPAPRRANFGDFDYTKHGEESVSTIYRGVGNSEVRQMIQQYFPEMSYYGRTTVWGYLVGSSPVFELKDAEILVAASITALGATRQARSHVKCAISVGNTMEVVTAVIETAREVGAWNRRSLSGEIDVRQLAEELERNLAKETKV
ncbi:hypothetical protein BDW59DRAFT_161075 [Aspergillus cavernicola]|uniref:Carboxymuconolactone decarboxylase-like domain-containing protein n=1 Tax=Aspergillus cavernicola TaxID=176166 RepID=A0ABR4IEP3_9EURO